MFCLIRLDELVDWSWQVTQFVKAGCIFDERIHSLYIGKSRKKIAKTQGMDPFVKDTTRLDKLSHLPRPINQFVKANEAKHQELFRKALQLFKKALSSF